MLVLNKPSLSEASNVLLVLKKERRIYRSDSSSFFRKRGFGLPGGRPRVPAEPEDDNATREVREETGIIVELLPEIKCQMGRRFIKIGRVGYQNPITPGELAADSVEIEMCDWYPISVFKGEAIEYNNEMVPFYKWHRLMAFALLDLISQQRLTLFQ